MVEGGGFEPPKLTRQIYSLIPLATREPLQKEALDSAFAVLVKRSQSKILCKENSSFTNSLFVNSTFSAFNDLVPPPRVFGQFEKNSGKGPLFAGAQDAHH